MKKPTIHDLYRSVIARDAPDILTKDGDRNEEVDSAHISLEEATSPLPDRASQKGLKLFLWDFKQCDSKKCTGRKLLRMGMVQPLKLNSTFRGLVLSPTATEVISPGDIKIAVHGLAVIDCSWNQLDKVPFQKLKSKNLRLLPKLIASNPIHYGKPFELSCIEAYVAALIILGFTEQANELISVYDWMFQFLSLNEDLQRYMQN